MRSLLVCLLSCCAIRAAAAEPPVRIAPDDADPTRVVASCAAPESLVDATPDQAAGRGVLKLAIVDEATRDAGPPMFGAYAVADGRLTFRPQFALVRGALYRATTADGATAEYRVPLLDGAEPATVVSITPGGDRLPANILRFYVTFSRPMREGREVLERIRLYDDAGAEIDSPWRELELWNADATRLSLFLHPGRIKQGVNLRVELGPILEPNRKYTLVVGDDLRDARGVPLGSEVRKTFGTVAELRARVDVLQWRLSSPAAGAREPLAIAFGRTMDVALARRCLQVVDAAGTPVPGEVNVADDGDRWTFRPAQPWRGEAYRVAVDPVLEDVCGNSPLRAFDVDLEAQPVEIVPPALERTFTPR